MDPNAALDMIRDAFKAGEYPVGAVLFAALDDWLKRGGFLPDDWADADISPRPQRTQVAVSSLPEPICSCGDENCTGVHIS
jgi:hypothetical protein